MPTVAAIDVGSNATRFATLTVADNGVAEPLQLERFAIRLGADVFAQGALGPAIRGTLKEAFAAMAKIMGERGVTQYRAVATSAMRDAKNSAEVVQELAEASGLRLDIIAGEEESRLSRDALLRAMGSVPAEAVIVDLGGGSLELDRPKSRKGRSLPLGTVRLLQRFPELRVPVGPDVLSRVREALASDLARGWRRAPKVPLAIGTGGNLELLAQLVGAPDAAVPRIRFDALPDFATTVAAMQVEARIAKYGLRPDRADLIVPAALVILALHDWLGLETLAVPKTGLRDALLYEQIAAVPQGTPAVLGHLQGTKVWQRHARRAVPWLAFWFGKLSPVHGLFPPALAPLRAAHAAWAAALGGHKGTGDGRAVATKAASLLHEAAAAHALAGTPDLAPDALSLAWQIVEVLAGTAPKEGHVAARHLAVVVHLAEACAQAHRGVPQGSVNLLDDPWVLTTPAPLDLPADALASLAHAFARPLVLRTRSH